MLKQVKKIKALGVFENYSAPADLPSLKRYNVIYGENGSGKTTLSRLFAALETGTHGEYPNLEYTIETDGAELKQGAGSLEKVRVFNSDYVTANIGQFDGPIPHILIVGEENKIVAAELKAEIATRDSRLAKVQEIEKTTTKLETGKGKVFSDIAKIIGEATSGATLRNYRKQQAEAAFAILGEAKPLDAEALAVHRATVKQEQMDSADEVFEPILEYNNGEIGVVQVCVEATARAKGLGERTAQSAAIARLSENRDIAQWVEAGVPIHTSHATGKCEFCQQTLPEGRMEALADYFSVEDQNLKNDIEDERKLLAMIAQKLGEFSCPDRAALYQELRADYEVALKGLKARIAEMRNSLSKLDNLLVEKLSRRATVYEIEVAIDQSTLVAALQAVNAIIDRHNTKTMGFNQAKEIAANAIAQHYLLTIKDQVDEFVEKISELKLESSLLQNGGEGLEDKRSIEAISLSIKEKQAKVSSAHAGGNDLTELLKQFLGREDIELASKPDGYNVLRRGKVAKRLSEGEKTAIAFLYFLVQLKDQNFDLENGVVVIDDPISSLDSSSIYQAFSFLKNKTQNAKQLIILTHNFEFLKLLLNWMNNIPGAKKKNDSCCCYLMVLCNETQQGRSAGLKKLDDLLHHHPTEYHYLFKMLHTFESDGTIQQSYPIANMARKVLESFLEFHVPSNKGIYDKLDSVVFDPVKKTAINKFANDLSHFTGKSFDPAIISETQKNVSYLMEMIKEVSPLHYDGMKALAEA